MHELECIIITLNKCDTIVADRYFSHQGFFKLEYEQDEKLAKQLDDEIKQHGLKPSQDRQYTNYGWLLYIDEFKELYQESKSKFRLDFKNGIQRYAGLQDEYVKYSTASKYIHPTGRLLYTDPQKAYKFIIGCLDNTLTNLANEFYKFLAENNLVDPDKLSILDEKIKQWFSVFEQNLEIVNEGEGKYDS